MKIEWNEPEDKAEFKKKATAANPLTHEITPEEAAALPEGHYSQPVMVRQNQGTAQWGLVPLDLVREACEFYLLEYLKQLHTRFRLGRASQVADLFEDKKALLTAQFVAYVDMAIGGELRHAAGQTQMTTLPAPIQMALRGDMMPGDRAATWSKWYSLRERFGTRLLYWTVEAFSKVHWGSGSFGGVRWGEAAATLLRWEEAQDRNDMMLKGNERDGYRQVPVDHDLMFIDTVFSLQHNGGAFLNKVWHTEGLLRVLDAAFQGDYWVMVDILHERACRRIADFYTNLRKRDRDGNAWWYAHEGD